MDSDVLDREITAVMGQLHQILSSSLKLFRSPSYKYELRSSDNTSNMNGIRGTMVLQEDTLCSMEILVKPTKASTLSKSTFREDKQWKLQQIQDAVNHLKVALNTLAVFSDPSKYYSSMNYSKSFIIDMLEGVTRSINMCRTRLFSPCKLSLEALVTSGVVKMFAPPLSGDSIINFFILEDSLVITHYTVQQMHSALSKNASTLRTPRLFHPIGAVLEHAGSQYEVVTAHKACCHIPWLTKTLLATDVCLQLASQLREKLLLAQNKR